MRFADLLPGCRIQAGQSLSAEIAYPNYSRADGWAASIVFMCETGVAGTIAVTTGAAADSFTVTVPATTTDAWVGGPYAYVVWLTKGDTKIVAENGSITVLPNPSHATPAMAILAAVNAVILGAAADDQLTVSVDGIQLRYWLKDRGIDEMLKLQYRFKQIVATELARAGGKGPAYAIQQHASEDRRLASPYMGVYPPGSIYP